MIGGRQGLMDDAGYSHPEPTQEQLLMQETFDIGFFSGKEKAFLEIKDLLDKEDAIFRIRELIDDQMFGRSKEEVMEDARKDIEWIYSGKWKEGAK